MKRKYSAFLINAGGCSDRYCSSYDRPYDIRELYQRLASVPLLSGVDLVSTEAFLKEIDLHKSLCEQYHLQAVSVVADHFTEKRWREGSFTSTDPGIRKEAVKAGKRAVDAALELGSGLVTIWPGQDGYDYPFATAYEEQRAWFVEGLREVCAYRPQVRISLEYKPREPRTHCYASTVGTAILMVHKADMPNLGLVLDYGHALMAGENPSESLSLIRSHDGRLMHVHMNDNFRSWDDDMMAGSVHTIELLEFLYWLRRTHYDGWIAMDQFPYRLDGRDALAESTAWLDSLESVLDRTKTDRIAAILSAKDAVAATRMVRELIFPGSGPA